MKTAPTFEGLDRTAECELAALARSGDRAAADRLTRAVLPLVKRFARETAAQFPAADPDEFLSVGLRTVAAAAPLFDPVRGTRWQTYAGTAAKREMYRAGQDEAARATRLPRDPDASPDDVAAPPPADGSEPLIDRVRAALARLGPLHAALVADLYGIDGEAVPLRAAAARLGLSVSRARAVQREALEQLGWDDALYSDGE